MPKKTKPATTDEQGPPQTLSFAANIAKMGDKRLIVIPKSLHYMLKAFEDKELVVMIHRMN